MWLRPKCPPPHGAQGVCGDLQISGALYSDGFLFAHDEIVISTIAAEQERREKKSLAGEGATRVNIKKPAVRKRQPRYLRLGHGRQLYAIELGDNGSSGLGVFLPFRARPNLDDRFRTSQNHLLAHPATRFGRVDTGETAACALTVKRGGVSVMPVTRKKKTSSKIDKR
jgi:hypothetical protein